MRNRFEMTAKARESVNFFYLQYKAIDRNDLYFRAQLDSALYGFCLPLLIADDDRTGRSKVRQRSAPPLLHTLPAGNYSVVKTGYHSLMNDKHQPAGYDCQNIEVGQRGRNGAKTPPLPRR